jgi:phosphoribosylformylglycinamidine synthase
MLVFFEKREPFRNRNREFLSDLREREGIESLTGVRQFSAYRISGPVTPAAVNNALRDPVTDLPMLTSPPADPEAEWSFSFALLPAQFDQRGESAREAISLAGGGAKQVRSISSYLFYGTLSEQERRSIRKILLNPVDSEEIRFDRHEELLSGFRSLKESELPAFAGSMGIALDTADLLFCRDYFAETVKRDPTRTELAVLATYWSDHCRHTTFNTPFPRFDTDSSSYFTGLEESLAEFRQFRGGDGSLMDMATAGAKMLKGRGMLDDLDSSEEINAASFRIEVEYDEAGSGPADPETWLLMFKNETHNHPTEIEPFGGASTCIGGAIRDPLSGRAYVHQAMRLSGAPFPDPRLEAAESELLRRSKLSRRRLALESARGYSSYGNQIGVPTGMVRELYDEGFRAKRFEAGAVVGAVPLERVRREQPEEGDLVILVGGATGRDGIGGATGSSRAHDDASVRKSAAEVQKGNPPEERALQRLFRRPELSALIRRCNDFGAGGVAVAVGELAPGLDIEIDAVPLKYSDLSPLEITLSESQERMAVVVERKDAARLISLAAEEDLDATVIAGVTGNSRLTIRYEGSIIADLPRALLDSAGAARSAEVRIVAPEDTSVFEATRIRRNAVRREERWASLLSEHNVCGGEGLTEQFDSSVGSRSVLSPLGGRCQLTPSEVMAALIPAEREGVKTASLMSCGYSPEISRWSPYHGALFALFESVCRAVAAGAELGRIRLSLQEYFPPPGDDPVRWGAPAAAVLGALRLQLALSVPAIGGKDSMSGSWMDIEVPPTLAAFAVSALPAASVSSPEFKKAGSVVYLLHQPRGGDEEPDYALFREHAEMVHRLHSGSGLLACRSVGYGGIAQAIAEMSFGNRIGFAGELPGDIDPFDPAYGSFIFEWDAAAGAIPEGIRNEIREEPASMLFRIGNTREEPLLAMGKLSISIEDALSAWRKPRLSLYPGPGVEYGSSTGLPPVSPGKPEKGNPPRFRGKGPAVSLFVFPGTNCEEETASAFSGEGGDVSVHLFRTRCGGGFRDSLLEMEKAVRKASIVVLPGGFSAGDEPDGAAKYIAAVLSHPRIADALSDLLEHRDGLMLGICNGFQALVRSGLLPHGRVQARKETDPVLDHNAIGRHVSRYCGTVCTSALGPWMSLSAPGDVQIMPVSHGEGRFTAPPEHLAELESRGQIAFRYCDGEGKPTEAYPDNPNGSVGGVEALLSPDGRILGKMGHSERFGRHVAKNIPGTGRPTIFRAGLDYFR